MKRYLIALLLLSLLAVPGANAGRSVSGVLASGRTTTGVDKGSKPWVWGRIRFTVQITGGTATVKAECYDHGVTVEIASMTATGATVTDYPCEALGTNVSAIAGATVNSWFVAVDESI